MGERAFDLAIEYYVINCCKCAFVFAVDNRWDNKRRRDHKSFWCPHCGTRQSYSGKSDLEKLKEEIYSERSNSKWYQRRFESEKKSKSALKGQFTKFKNRIGVGVCPCCKRNFKQLARHMENKHPDYGKS